MQDIKNLKDALAALVSTFSIVLEDDDTGRQALEAVNTALLNINTLLKDDEMTTPPAPTQAYVTALQALTYSVTESFNGDAMHIIEAHLRTTPEELTLDQLVMTLNMCRVVRNGKEARLTVAQRADIASMHLDFTALRNTKKAQREALSEIEKRLEDQHGKYAAKTVLVKTKFDTSVSYREGWLDQVTGFVDAVFDEAPAPAVEPAPAPAVEYLPEPLPAHYIDTPFTGGEVEAYIDTQTDERLGVDAKGRVWRTPRKKVSALDLFLKR